MQQVSRIVVGWALWTAGCTAATTQVERTARPAEATATMGQPVAVAGPASGKKRGGGGPLFQVRLIDGAAAGRTARAPGEAALQ